MNQLSKIFSNFRALYFINFSIFMILFASFLNFQFQEYAYQIEDSLHRLLDKDIANGDIFEISEKLNAQAKVIDWKCITGFKDKKAFLTLKKDDCQNSVFAKRISIQKSERPDISIEILLLLPASIQILVLTYFVFIIILISIVLYLLNRSHQMQLGSEKEKVSALKKQAYKIAHDLRSPLAVLQIVKESNYENAAMANMAIERIDSIANDLLIERARQEISSFDLKLLIEQIIEEKKIQFGHVSFIFAKCLDTNTAKVNKVNFQAIISNLLNNSIEANSTEIEFKTFKNKDKIILEIKDNGDGIPPEVLKKLLKEEISFNKEKGNGIGLTQAKRYIESWGGSIAVKSTLGKYTIVTISLDC